MALADTVQTETSNRQLTVVGADGYVGRALLQAARAAGRPTLAAVARGDDDLAAGRIALTDVSRLDVHHELLSTGTVVLLPQLQRAQSDWLIDRIDGPRWVLFSSAQLASRFAPPGQEIALARERLALERGAVVLRPTMIFGRGGDHNISRVARKVRRTKVPLQLGEGDQLVQPVHVDDLIDLVLALPADGPSGRFEVGGRDVVSSLELMTMLVELLGVRTPPVAVPRRVLTSLAPIGRLVGLRGDQIERLFEDKVVDNTAARELLAYDPAPIAHRLEQAVRELDEAHRVGPS